MNGIENRVAYSNKIIAIITLTRYIYGKAYELGYDLCGIIEANSFNGYRGICIAQCMVNEDLRKDGFDLAKQICKLIELDGEMLFQSAVSPTLFYKRCKD